MLTKRSWLLYLLGFACVGDAAATAQIPEEIVLDGRTEMLFSEPLNQFLLQPDNLAKLEPYLSKERCSGSWRGYRGRWEIVDGRLYLTALKTDPCSQHPNDVPLDALFLLDPKPGFARWYTGTLVVPMGQLVSYVHMGYESRYERYTIFTVKQGVVISRRLTTEQPK